MQEENPLVGQGKVSLADDQHACLSILSSRCIEHTRVHMLKVGCVELLREASIIDQVKGCGRVSSGTQTFLLSRSGIFSLQQLDRRIFF
jgi:hypothetical protein